tara:strand:+ start:83 stop:241 length:159 start_codon:yes stop_codon:yes gene_type:complete
MIPFNNSKLESKIERVIKLLPYQQNKNQFVEDAVLSYIEGLYKEKVIKQRIQ